MHKNVCLRNNVEIFNSIKICLNLFSNKKLCSNCHLLLKIIYYSTNAFASQFYSTSCILNNKLLN